MKTRSILAVRRGVPPWGPNSTVSNTEEWLPTKLRSYISVLSGVFFLLGFSGLAQGGQQGLPQYSSLTGHCDGTIYKGSQIPIDHKAKIRNRTAPNMTPQALSKGTHGTVVIEAVLCRNGQVTDLEVFEGLPNGLTEEAIRSVLAIEFTPAEIDLHSVSQKMRFEFFFSSLDDGKSGVLSPRDAEGKLIRRIEIVGNRRLPASEIIALLKTEPGNKYSEEQAKQDLASLLSSGYFTPGNTSVTTEGGPDGDVTVIFEVHELPLISEVHFEGLKNVTASEIITALHDENFELGPGSIYDPGKIKTVTGLIKKALGKNGQKDAKVEVRTEEISFDRVSLTFVISYQ